MDELVTQLKRIADALEEQNRLYVDRCIKIDMRDTAYEQRRYKRDLEIVEKQHQVREAQLEMEHRNLLLVHQLYAEHPELTKGQVALLEAKLHGDE